MLLITSYSKTTMGRSTLISLPFLLMLLLAVACSNGGDDPNRVPPDVPDSSEGLVAETLAANAKSEAAIREFTNASGDPCSLPLRELISDGVSYQGIAALVNDVDLIVSGRAIETITDDSLISDGAGEILTSFLVEDVLKGTAASGSISVASGHRVALLGGVLSRYTALGLDFCTEIAEQQLLFLHEVPDADYWKVAGAQAWARTTDGRVEGSDFNGLFSEYERSVNFLAQVGQLVSDQDAALLPKGLVVCEEKRSSELFVDPVACPGERFNPYVALGFENAQRLVVTTTDPGPGTLSVAVVQVLRETAQYERMTVALDIEVTLDPAYMNPSGPEDVIKVRVDNSQSSIFLWYSPASGVIQVPSGGGAFAAPTAFQDAMEPFLALE